MAPPQNPRTPKPLKVPRGHSWREIPLDPAGLPLYGGWVAIVRTAALDGAPVVVHVEIGLRDLSADGSLPVPRGGLTSRMLRGLRLDNALRDAEQTLGIIEKRFGADSLRALGYAPADMRRQARRRTGRRGHPDAFYASVASRYVEAVKGGSRTPIRDLARILNFSPDYVRDIVKKARTRGLLTATKGGKPGGQLTDAAFAHLDVKKKPKRKGK